MRSRNLPLLALLVALAGCKPEEAPVELLPVRTVAVDFTSIGDDRQAIGEIKPRYESDLSFREAALVEAQSTEARQARLLKDGWTPRATYDTALRNLRAAEARLAAAKANPDLTRDQLNYTELKAEFDGVITMLRISNSREDRARLGDQKGGQ